MIIEYENDEDSYIEWQIKNADGYILKTKSNKNTSEPLSFHKSKCRHVYKYTYKEINGKLEKVITFTNNGNIKICSLDSDEIVRWANNNRLATTRYKICTTCNPNKIRVAISNQLTGWKEIK